MEVAQAEITQKTQEVDRLSAAVAAARSEGRAQGLIEGAQAAEDRSEALLRVMTDAAATSVTLLGKRLDELQEVVGDLAAVALERIVGDVSSRQSLVVDTVRRAVGALFVGSVVAVEVSREDFPDAVTLQAVLPQGCEAHSLDSLPSGGCRLRLRLGEVDLGLHGQVARLRALLDPAGVAVR